jgi:signal transduction histidine kinase
LQLHEFITRNLDAILQDWVAFARELQPAGGDLDEAALLDHGRLILAEIAADMQKPQSDLEQQDKSEGNQAEASGSTQVPSRTHARQRKQQGFNIEELVAEYRALRATVLRLWSKATGDVQGTELESVTRFNEAVDQAIAESLQTFMAELDQSRDLFLGVLGHDLRGPLGTIASVANLQLRTRPDDSREAAIVLRSVAQMKVLLDDLVEYARHRRNAGFDIAPQKLHLGDFTRNTLDEIAAIRDGHAIHLDIQGNVEGEWDAKRLHQAISNLIFNALKYGETDAPIFITLDGTSPEEVSITVQNTGKPIPAALQATLFDPFVRAWAEDTGAPDAWGTGAGMGLGLYVVQQITQAHGGSVEVISNDALTRFSVCLPRAQPRAMG